jgi:hypothetical protein
MRTHDRILELAVGAALSLPSFFLLYWNSFRELGSAKRNQARDFVPVVLSFSLAALSLSMATRAVHDPFGRVSEIVAALSITAFASSIAAATFALGRKRGHVPGVIPLSAELPR